MLIALVGTVVSIAKLGCFSVFQLYQEDGTGLVKVLNNVEFDWPEGTNEKKHVTGELLCLVLTPTRELAVQVKNHIETVAKYTDIKVIVQMHVLEIPRLLFIC